MFDPFTIALIGGAAGGLLNKKDPLKGALLGAGLGAAGGAIAPAVGGLLGAPAAGATGLGVLDPAQAAAIAAEKGTTVAAAFPGSQPGLLATAKDGLKTAGEYAKPLGEAGMAAQQVGGLFGSDQQAPQAYQSPGDNGSLAQIAQADQQGLLALQDQDMKRRQQQMALIQQMMGRNYG